MLTSADELQRRIADERLEPAAAPAAFEEPAPAEIVSVGPAAETPTIVASSYDTLVGQKPRVEKPCSPKPGR
jgi:hypothetical protein